MRRFAVLGLLCVPALGLGGAREPVDLEVVTAIREEGFRRSQVMDTAWHLTDRYGPRLTGSPALRAAAEWARGRLLEWGLERVDLEPWGEFGRGWSFEKVMVEMTAPAYMPVIAIPEAWTPGTAGVLTGQPVLVEKADSVADLEPHAGKLQGRIVLLGAASGMETSFDPVATRHTPEALEEIALAPEPSARPPFEDRRREWEGRREERKKVTAWLREQGVGVLLKPGGRRGDYGVLFVGSGGSYKPDEEPAVPSVVVAAEHYNRIVRLLKKDVPVEVAVEVRTTFHDEDRMGFNVVAEIPGCDPVLRDEVVMLGGHFDSWHGATGATDNGASCAVVMEAMRILRAIEAKPRRTIRMALWTGEEQGLLGSKGYVKQHFADPETMELLPEHARFAAYFNLDNGVGKIRGIYCQENAAVRPIFEAWLAPFADLGATTVTIRNTGGTDHLSFDRVGLPGFQFIQDPLDYSTRTHHTNMDTYERILPGDVMQASVVMASFAYNAAMREQRLPRKPLPEPEPKPEAQPSGE